MERDIKAELAAERAPIAERVEKLVAFMRKGKPDIISEPMWMLMASQLDAMNDYAELLAERIGLIEEEEKEQEALAKAAQEAHPE